MKDSSKREIHFPPTLTSAERHRVHILADAWGLAHQVLDLWPEVACAALGVKPNASLSIEHLIDGCTRATPADAWGCAQHLLVLLDFT